MLNLIYICVEINQYDLLDSVSSLELVHFANNEPKESRVVYEKNSINIFFEELKKHKYMKPEFARYFKTTKIPDPWTGFSILGYDKKCINLSFPFYATNNIIPIIGIPSDLRINIILT